jgi:trimeric autotransporter adhesin
MLSLSGKSLVVTVVAVVCALSLVSCKGFFVDPTLSSIAFGQPTPSVAKGATFQMQAIGTYSDNTTKDITSKVTWTSSDTNLFTVNSAGLITGANLTTAGSLPTVKAALGTVSATTTVTVTTAALTSITVDGNASPSIATTGGTALYTATGHYSDNSTQSLTNSATWDSSDKTVATIESGATNGGKATFLKAGSTTLSASQGSVSGTLAVTVSN